MAAVSAVCEKTRATDKHGLTFVLFEQVWHITKRKQEPVPCFNTIINGNPPICLCFMNP